MPAQAAQQDYFTTVAANLKTNPGYVDLKASPSISAGEASTLTSKIKASGRPIFLVLMDNSQVGSNTADQVLSKIAAGLNRPAVIGVSSNKGFAANGYGEHSPGGYSLAAGLVAELVLTAGFLFVIMGATDQRAPAGFAPIAIGLALTLIHLISIPITNTSVNPARSTGPAILVGGWALAQLWLFWLAPILGGIAGATAYRWLASVEPVSAPEVSPAPAAE